MLPQKKEHPKIKTMLHPRNKHRERYNFNELIESYPEMPGCWCWRQLHLPGFGGRNHELWCDGGEKQFVQNMIFQSREYADSCLWFTTLISKEANLKAVYATLKKVNPVEIKTINMGQGNKISRIVAWTFFEKGKRGKF